MATTEPAARVSPPTLTIRVVMPHGGVPASATLVKTGVETKNANTTQPVVVVMAPQPAPESSAAQTTAIASLAAVLIGGAITWIVQRGVLSQTDRNNAAQHERERADAAASRVREEDSALKLLAGYLSHVRSYVTAQEPFPPSASFKRATERLVKQSGVQCIATRLSADELYLMVDTALRCDEHAAVFALIFKNIERSTADRAQRFEGCSAEWSDIRRSLAWPLEHSLRMLKGYVPDLQWTPTEKIIFEPVSAYGTDAWESLSNDSKERLRYLEEPTSPMNEVAPPG